MRIPVRVVDDDRVCTRQVDTETSGSRGEQEAELLCARGCDDTPGSRGVSVTRAVALETEAEH